MADRLVCHGCHGRLQCNNRKWALTRSTSRGLWRDGCSGSCDQP
ncbi:hypothetical protein FHS72_000389 [Loktanella ponticola]|uniref:Uncharacterized protein n=1 Tax=Yoonia ponticola TaxID=1524255 RepID=A0A7W9BHZ1_9RHOB|nr:hypothetical protein [Yoonia ponticola]